ncbi:ricin-type beta-trefoil lectin protein [Promicromonospora sp. AC04]|uniref:family 43 glycosylhydrolase n=1 Tax=Promicromonospora sp. AC04 TaxID=2135723 RepID=UPI000D3AC9BB|nr:family 43 glycosylhydrolase [Promicromonospora sp. AC04]PUB27684.1 ricin-type beta-trefoil lectin protein [Promicromonospora sp. AC04]
MHQLRRPRGGLLAALGTALILMIGSLVAAPASALDGETRLHDPSIIKVNGCYYAYTTGFENDPANPSGSIMVYRTCQSTPAGGWQKIGNVWESTPAWVTQAHGGTTPPNIWAPDINYFDGEYHLYYGTAIWGVDYAAMGLLTAPSPTGPWTDRGMVTDVNYPIDPDVVRGEDGRMYLAWGSFGGIYLHVLDESTGKLSTTDHNLWHLATNMEGASIVQDGGYFYLLAPTGTCCNGTSSGYNTVVGRATSVSGPYVDQSGRNLVDGSTTVILRGAWPRVAAGGGDVYTDGTDRYLAYHYYDADNGGRETLDIRQLSFAGGWPILDAPLGKSDVVLQTRHSQLCADVWFASTTAGAEVRQGSCNGGDNQLWQTTRNGNTYEFRATHSGQCLEIYGASTTQGATANQWTCNGGNNQKWERIPVIGAYSMLRNVATGQCLEVSGYNTTSGTVLSQWPCNGGDNQLWLMD